MYTQTENTVIKITPTVDARADISCDTQTDISDIDPMNISTDYVPSSDTESISFSDSEKINLIDPEKEKKYIVFESKLEELILFCKVCGAPVVQKTQFLTGSMVACNVTCQNHHSYTWHSQPLQNKKPLGNLALAASIIVTGNTYQKTNALARAMNLQIISKTSFNKLQKSIFLPVIQEQWEKTEKMQLKK